MKANKFRALWIILLSSGYTLYYSMRVLFQAMRGVYRRHDVDQWTHRWAHHILNIVGIKTRIVNPHQVSFNDNKRYIIMSNHASHYDIPIIISCVPGSIRMLAKKELFRIPIWGRALRLSEFVAIDRVNRKQAIADLENAKAKLESGIRLWLAPEGTRSPTGKLQPFKKGGFMLAIQTGAMIVPIGIRGANQVLSAKSIEFHLNQAVDVHIGEPIDASQYTIGTRQQLMQVVESRLRETLEQSQ